MNSSPQPSPLPIRDVLPALIDALRSGESVVVRAPPGAGKTTGIPPAILQSGLCPGKIVMLEPRRLAARAAARWIAGLLGEPVGGQVGYHVRFDRQAGPHTRLLIVTEGILLRMMLEDPFLSEVELVIFDEFHERRLDSDLALGMLRLIQQTVRPQLRLLVMSATLDTQQVESYLTPCRVITSQGRMHPVEIVYQPEPRERSLSERIATAARQLVARTSGDLLIFVPGVREIQQAINAMQDMRQDGFAILPLYGDLPARQQDEALSRMAQRRIIVATNVAETSVTVDGVTGVIDTGLARLQRFDPRLGLDRLEVVAISQASAEQRAGRAGRLQPGICVRLWDAAAHRLRSPFTEPDVRRLDLAPALLTIKGWIESDERLFPWFEAPRPESLERARLLLEQLGALRDGAITPLGKQIARLPIHPRLARMLLEGQRRGAGGRAALAAALLSERDPFVRAQSDPRPRGTAMLTRSDLLDRIEALEHFERDKRASGAGSNLQPHAARAVLRTRDQLLRLLRHKQSSADEKASAQSDEALLRAVVAAFPDRIALRREAGSRKGVMVGGRGIRLTEQSGVLEPPLLVCIDIDAGANEALVRIASEAQRKWLSPTQLHKSVEVEFDDAQQRIVARQRTRYIDLLLEEHPAALPRDGSVEQLLVQHAVSQLEQVLPPDESDGGQLLIRIRSLSHWLPEAQLPPLDAAQVCELIRWLAHGRRSFDELRNGPWTDAIRSLLTAAQWQLVQREAPQRLTLPSGKHVALRYEPQRPPILAVRIQEIFAWQQTPRIASQRVPVLLHLLAPNFRPVQITDDLASFWQNTYRSVRAELRRRYPKHAWPEDPRQPG